MPIMYIFKLESSLKDLGYIYPYISITTPGMLLSLPEIRVGDSVELRNIPYRVLSKFETIDLGTGIVLQDEETYEVVTILDEKY